MNQDIIRAMDNIRAAECFIEEYPVLSNIVEQLQSLRHKLEMNLMEGESLSSSGCPHCGSYEGDETDCPECGHGLPIHFD